MPLKLIQLRTSKNWYIRGTVRGKSIYETTGTEDRQAAEEIRIRRESEILTETIHGAATTATFERAAVEYMEAPDASARERRFIFPLVEMLGSRACNKIGQTDIDLIVRRRYPKAKASTIVRSVITPLSSVLNYAAKRGWCQPPKFDRPRQAPVRRSVFTRDQAALMVEAAAPHLRPLLVFLFFTGARLSEALELEWKDVDLSARWAVFIETKRHDEPRGVPLHPAVIAALEALPHRQGRVFASSRVIKDARRRRHMAGYADTGRAYGGQIKRAWGTALRRAGLVGLTPHCTRHSFSTWLTMAGVHEQVRDEIMGHASQSMGRHYAHVAQASYLAAIDRLPPLPLPDLSMLVTQAPKPRTWGFVSARPDGVLEWTAAKPEGRETKRMTRERFSRLQEED